MCKDTDSAAPAQAPAPPAIPDLPQLIPVHPTEILQFIKENFVVVSGLAIVIGIALSTMFLSAYLTVFDWHLIWFIEYTDILTFGLIGIAVIGTSYVFLDPLVRTVLGLGIFNGKRAWKGLLIFVGFWTLLYALLLFAQYRSAEPHYQYITAAWLSVIGVLALVVTPALYLRSRVWPSVGQIIAILASATFGVLSFGQWLGYSMLYSQFNQDVHLKGTTLSNVKLVAVLTRHTILLDGKMYASCQPPTSLSFEALRSRGTGLKAFLEHFAAIVGAITVAILAMSLAHEYAYFMVIGSQFQTFLTTTDYLTNGVVWLPFAILFLYNWADWGKLKDVPQLPTKKNWKKWTTWIGPVLATAYFLFTVAFFTWPLDYFEGINVLIVLFFLWSKLWRTYLPKAEIEEPFRSWIRQAVRLGPPAIFGLFIYGSIQANTDLTRMDQPYIFRLKGADHSELRIFLRNFDKGVLVRNASDNRIEFYKWHDIETVARVAPTIPKTFLCRWTGWMCGTPQPPPMQP